MTPEQEAAIARVSYRVKRLAKLGTFHPDRAREKQSRAHNRADRALLFLSAEGGINSAPWMQAQLEVDCAELLYEAQSERVSFEAARIVASVLRREKVSAPSCIQEFEDKLISGELMPPNQNGNYLEDQLRVDAQIHQFVSDLCEAGYTKSLGNAKSVFLVVSQLLESHGVKMGEQAVRTSYRRARKAEANGRAKTEKAIADQAEKWGKS